MTEQQIQRMKRIEREYKDASESNDVRFLLSIIKELQEQLPKAPDSTELPSNAGADSGSITN